MKRSTMFGLAAMACLALGVGIARRAHAVNPSDQFMARPTYVVPSFAAPRRPVYIGKDGGTAGQVQLDAGVCVRLAARGTWRYMVEPWDTFPDAGPIVNFATGALRPGDDGGTCYYADGGVYLLPDAGPVVYPDAGFVLYPDAGPVLEPDAGPYPPAGLYAGGPCVLPEMTPIFDGNIEGWCFNSSQSVISATSEDGGYLTISPRYP